jgi:L-ascorbate metabolism protein UlaG (beta-lactamase superfamily)
VKILYIGHSAFAMEADDKSVLIDPFITGNPGATVSPDDFSPQTIILTHAHNDHVGDTVAIAKRSGAKVIATHELATWIGSQGVEGAWGANHGGTVQFEGGSTKFTPAWHTSSYSLNGSFVAPGLPTGQIVRFGGTTTYFAGDTCLFGDMALIGQEGIDVAVLPIGDNFTMGPDDAIRAIELINPAMVIPCHYNTFPPIRQDGMSFKARVESETTARCLLLNPGESIEI